MRFLKNKRGNKKQRKRQGYFGAAHAEESGRGVETKIKKIKKRVKSKTKSRELLKKKREQEAEKKAESFKKIKKDGKAKQDGGNWQKKRSGLPRF